MNLEGTNATQYRCVHIDLSEKHFWAESTGLLYRKCTTCLGRSKMHLTFMRNDRDFWSGVDLSNWSMLTGGTVLA